MEFKRILQWLKVHNWVVQNCKLQNFKQLTSFIDVTFPKGQLISKGLFSVFNSSKKWTKKFCPNILGQKLKFSSSFFLEELKTPKRHFEISWPLQNEDIKRHFKTNWCLQNDVPYARLYNPRFVYFLPHFSVWFIIKSD